MNHFITVAALFALTCASEKPDEQSKEDSKKLQGTWQVTKFIDQGGPVPAEEIKDFTFEFKDDQVFILHDKDCPKRGFKFKLDAGKKPKGIEVEIPVEYKTLGIYKFDGDELTICLVAGKNGDKEPVRPSEFKASKDGPYTLFVMKKIKK